MLQDPELVVLCGIGSTRDRGASIKEDSRLELCGEAYTQVLWMFRNIIGFRVQPNLCVAVRSPGGPIYPKADHVIAAWVIADQRIPGQVREPMGARQMQFVEAVGQCIVHEKL